MAESLAQIVTRIAGHEIEPSSHRKISRHGHEFQMGVLADSPTREAIFTKQSQWSSGVDTIDASQLPEAVRAAFGVS